VKTKKGPPNFNWIPNGQFWGILVVFPIQGKSLKPGFWVAEKKKPGKPFFSGFELKAILSGKNSMSL